MQTSPAPVLVVANPTSGGGLAGELVPYLAKELSARGYPVELFQSAGPGQIAARVAEARGPHAALVAVGGDGTVREVLAAVPATGEAPATGGATGEAPPLAVLPAGTANVLAAELRLPKAPREVAALVAEGEARAVDAGWLRRGAGAKAEPFLLFVGAGVDAQVVARVHAKRAGGTLGKLAYVGPILASLLRYRPDPYWFVLEDARRHGPFAQILVTNVASYGGLWKLPGSVSIDDGLFDCFGFRATRPARFAMHALRGTFNRLREGPDLVHLRAHRVRVECEAEGICQVDGDPAGPCPVEVEVRPRALRILVPRTPAAP